MAKQHSEHGESQVMDAAPKGFGLVEAPGMKHDRMDVFSNKVTGLGGHNSKTACNKWMIQFGQIKQVLENFYRFSAIGARIVDKEPQDALRKGYFIDSPEIDESLQRDINAWNRRRQFLSKFSQARKWERLFGGALIFMDIDDGRKVDEPLDRQNIRRFGQLTVLNRYDVNVSEHRNDPITGNLATPAFYNLNLGGGRIHPSRVIVFGGIPLTIDQMLSNESWGGSAIDRAWMELERYITSQDYLAEGVTRNTQGVFKTNMLAASADCNQVQLMQDRMAALGQWMGMLGDIIIGEDEEYKIEQRGLQGFKDASEIFVNALTAATDMPKSIAFGLTPGGLNTGENLGDWQSWTSHLGGVQTEIYDPRIVQYQDLVFRSDNSPLTFIPETWGIGWLDLFQISDLDKSKVLTGVTNAAVALVNAGIISRNEARSNKSIQEAFPTQEASTFVAGTGDEIVVSATVPSAIPQITAMAEEDPEPSTPETEDSSVALRVVADE